MKQFILIVIIFSLFSNDSLGYQRIRQSKSERIDLTSPRIVYKTSNNRTVSKSDTVVLPEVVNKVSPEFPDIQWHGSGVVGLVTVKVYVDSIGHVNRADVLSSTAEIFNESTIQAVYKWKFIPFVLKNQKSHFIALLPFKYISVNRQLKVVLPV